MKTVQSVKIRILFILLLLFPPAFSRARKRSAGRSASVRRGAGVCPLLWTRSWRNGSSRWTGRCCRRRAFRYGRNSPLTAFHNLYRVPFFSRPSVHKDSLYCFVFHILLMLKTLLSDGFAWLCRLLCACRWGIGWWWWGIGWRRDNACVVSTVVAAAVVVTVAHIIDCDNTMYLVGHNDKCVQFNIIEMVC